ncbi:MAG: hypothetical protein CL878_01275 [Dehalococcoidia bacterium]|nr:hypothetical protein [Dehalococcoidia bacterium]
MTDDGLEWLLAGDPSVAWQVRRDLLGEAPASWEPARRSVSTTGWGARLLDLRAADGTWGGGLYSPKWISTFYTLRLLTHFGLGPWDDRGADSAALLLDRGVRDSGGVRLWKVDVTDTCVTAMLLSMALAFGLDHDPRCPRMVGFLLGEQMPDGGFNCEYRNGATHGSFHTTISVLEALSAWATRHPDTVVSESEASAREFLLVHRLFRSHRTGEVVRPAFTRFSFPPRWKYDVLRALDYFQSADAPWDERLREGLDLVHRKQTREGVWKLQNRHSGRTHFELEAPGTPSRWNTLRALRVLRWVSRAKT